MVRDCSQHGRPMIVHGYNMFVIVLAVAMYVHDVWSHGRPMIMWLRIDVCPDTSDPVSDTIQVQLVYLVKIRAVSLIEN